MATVTSLKKKQAGFDLNAVLSSAAKPQTKASSKVPVLTVDPATQQKVQRLREIKEQLESLEAEEKIIEDDLVTALAPSRLGLMQTNGYLASVKVPDGKGLSATITWSSRYSKIDLGSASAIEAIVGDS